MSQEIEMLAAEVEVMEGSEVQNEHVSRTALPENNIVIDADYLVDCITRGQDAICVQNAENPSPGFDPMSFPCKIQSEFVWIKRSDGTKVECVNDLLEVVSDLTHLTQMQNYTGKDKDDVFVLTGRLPLGKWKASVRNVMFMDIPSEFIKNKKVQLALLKCVKKNGYLRRQLKWVCRGVGGIATDAAWGDIPQKQIIRYHAVTMKITRDTHRMISWIPGLDVRSNPFPEFRESGFVELSQDEEYIPKPMKKVWINKPKPAQVLTLKDLR